MEQKIPWLHALIPAEHTFLMIDHQYLKLRIFRIDWDLILWFSLSKWMQLVKTQIFIRILFLLSKAVLEMFVENCSWIGPGHCMSWYWRGNTRSPNCGQQRREEWWRSGGMTRSCIYWRYKRRLKSWGWYCWRSGCIIHEYQWRRKWWKSWGWYSWRPSCIIY